MLVVPILEDPKCPECPHFADVELVSLRLPFMLKNSGAWVPLHAFSFMSNHAGIISGLLMLGLGAVLAHLSLVVARL